MYDFHNVALTPNQSLLLNITILSVIVFAVIRSERRMDDSNPLAMIGILAIFGIAGRILLDPLPNFQPVTVIVLLAGIYYGAPRAVALAGIIALTTNFVVLGHGPWTLFQVAGWGFVGILGAIFAEHLLKEGQLQLNKLAGLAVISAFAFDWIVSVSILLNTDASMLAPYLINGLLFDLYHAVGNLVFVAWLANPLGEIMLRHRVEPSSQAVSEVVTN
jgi:energy-coupling factor transport system substrate-specific component|tara:strand:+ start:721 stop:1374 length:654 start_codon:yes stop_codon:yes gene_type:complete